MTDQDQASSMRLPDDVRRILRRTPPAQWSALALLFDVDGTSRIFVRADLVSWCRANDLPELADVLATRKVRRGGLLALVLGVDGAHVHVL
jgi:hypothetical protein